MAFKVEDKKIFLPYPKGEYTTESIFSPNSSENILILQSCWPVGDILLMKISFSLSDSPSKLPSVKPKK